MEIIYKKTEDLIPYENNPRKNDAAVDLVANSIDEFGFKVPIVVDKDNIIVAGHTRLKAAEKLGLKEVPVIIADDLTEEQVNAFRLADNKTAERSLWDYNRLEIELGNIINIDMSDFGFNLDVGEYIDNFFDEGPTNTAPAEEIYEEHVASVKTETVSQWEKLRSLCKKNNIELEELEGDEDARG